MFYHSSEVPGRDVQVMLSRQLAEKLGQDVAQLFYSYLKPLQED
jgi:hypothetical protein